MTAPNVKAMSSIQLTDSQQGAADAVLQLERSKWREHGRYDWEGRYYEPGRIIKLNGPAGTGKTTMIKPLAHQLRAVVVTPTNRAAAVLRKKGIPARTIHSVFFTCQEGVDYNGKKSMRFVPNYEVQSDLLSDYDEYCTAMNDRGQSPGQPFTLFDGKLAWANTVIVDEASMLASWMIKEMLRMCSTLILVGDDFQLPPVRDKKYPNGQFNTMPADASLTEVLRQAGGSVILDVATQLRTGGQWSDTAFRKGLVKPPTHETYAVPGRRFITPTHAWRVGINSNVRNIQGIDTPLPVVGEPVVCKENVSENFVNGTLGDIVAVGPHPQYPGLLRIVVDDGIGHQEQFAVAPWLFYCNAHGTVTQAIHEEVADAWDKYNAASNPNNDPPYTRFDFGYAMTCHAAQGGEWNDVAVVGSVGLLEKIFRDADKSFPERWMYTGITRAKQELTLMSSYTPIARPSAANCMWFRSYAS